MNRKKKNYSSWGEELGIQFSFSETESAKDIILNGGIVTVQGNGLYKSRRMSVTDNPSATISRSAEFSKVSLSCKPTEVTYLIGGREIDKQFYVMGKKPVGFANAQLDKNFKFFSNDPKSFQRLFSKTELQLLLNNRDLFHYGWIRREGSEIIFGMSQENLSKTQVGRLNKGLELIEKLAQLE